MAQYRAVLNMFVNASRVGSDKTLVRSEFMFAQIWNSNTKSC